MKNPYKYHPEEKVSDDFFACKMDAAGLKDPVVEVFSFPQGQNENPYLQGCNHTHDFYVILVFKEGEGCHVVELEEHEVDEMEVFLLAPGMVHSYEKSQLSGFAIFFSEELFSYFPPMLKEYSKKELFNLGKGPVCFTHLSKSKDIIETIENQLLAEHSRGETAVHHIEYMAILISRLLIELERRGEKNRSNPKSLSDPHYLHYLSYSMAVEANFKRLHTVKDYAAMLNLSLATLNNSVAIASYQTPLGIINSRLLLEAKRMLRFRPDLQVKEIATELGFKDASHFVRFFYRHTALTPTAFRKK
ncbi:MAG: helix-turn-helix transcriptional regulator [Bacteroidales bacterium]|nr:helix-turn-helix transcriptional regulator [Bacteroidales bacterium]